MLQRVSRGQRVDLIADDWNRIVDMVNCVEQLKSSGRLDDNIGFITGDETRGRNRDFNCVNFVNKTSKGLQRGDVIDLGQAVYDCKTQPLGRKNPAFDAETPSGDDCNWAIVVKGTTKGCSGKAALDGVHKVQVICRSPTDGFVKPIKDQYDCLETTDCSSAQIVGEKPDLAVGEKGWVLIRLGNCNCAEEPCKTISDIDFHRNTIHCANTVDDIDAGETGTVEISEFGIEAEATNIGPGDAPAGSPIIVFITNDCQCKFTYPCCDDSCSDSSSDTSEEICRCCIGESFSVTLTGEGSPFVIDFQPSDGNQTPGCNDFGGVVIPPQCDVLCLDNEPPISETWGAQATCCEISPGEFELTLTITAERECTNGMPDNFSGIETIPVNGCNVTPDTEFTFSVEMFRSFPAPALVCTVSVLIDDIITGACTD